MDKTLIFALATAFTASLFADTTYISGTGFEPLDAGADVLAKSDDATSTISMWEFTTPQNRSTSLTVMEYDETAESSVPVPYGDPKYRTSDGDNEKYLLVDSGSDVLSRHVGQWNPETGVWGAYKDNVVDISDNGGIYMDTMVQFTATDTPPTPDSADKLLVWLYAPPDDPSSTNLMVTAGTYADGSYSSIATTNTIPVTCVEIFEREWHRLTIVAEMFSYGASSSTARFKLYIDGKQLVASDGTSKFPSLIAYYLPNYETLKTLNFNGEGAVDDVVFGAGNPFPPKSLAYTITLGEGVTGFSYSVDGVDMDEAEIEDGKFVFTDVDSILKTFQIKAVFYAEGYQTDPASTLSDTITEDGGFTIMACKTGFTVVVDGGDPVACASLADVASKISEASSATVTLSGDYVLNEGEFFEVACDVTLDLAGRSLTSDNQDFVVLVVAGTLEIKDSVGGGGIEVGVELEEGLYLVQSEEGAKAIFNVPNTTKFTGAAICANVGEIVINGGSYSHMPVGADGLELESTAYYPAGGYKLAKADGDEYYTLQEAGDDETTEVSADEVASTQYDTEEAAKAVTIVAPNNASLSDAEKTAYSGYVTTAVVESDGKYVVNAVFTDEKEGELQKLADEAAAAALAASADGKIEVSAVPGLYYALDHGSALPLEESEPTLAPSGAEKVEFTVEKDAEQGFYRVRISPTK